MLIGIIGLAVFLSSCKTYYIPIDSFKKQFWGMEKMTFKKVTVRGPIGDKVTYQTFPFNYVNCIDKKGNTVQLKIIPSLEIRFTDIDNKRTTFYLDRIFVNDTAVTGAQSRLMTINKSIPISSIKKIEIQDGKKKFSYLN